ncbi:MAG: response regulator [Gammaproteobacteria bacterium]|nr:response regulator [Gammaproteobacteria bacterium]
MHTQSHKKTILIVDDNVQILHALQIRLESENYNVEVAHDCLSGELKAREIKPDIVLLDINLPGANGFTLAEKIDMSCRKDVKKIFMTASRDESFPIRAMRCGAVDYLEKPFSSEALIEMIDCTASGHPRYNKMFV